MQSYDVVMILVLVGATIFGAWKGMAWQIASIASLVVSYFASLAFSAKLAPLISNEAPWNRFIAMLVIYLVTSMVIWTLFRLVAKAIDRVQLREFDRQIGALFGLAKGVLLCVAITMFAVTLMPVEQKEKILGSKSGMYIAKLLNEADQVMPKELHEVLHPYIHKAQETLDPNYVPHGDERNEPRTATRPEENGSNAAAPQFTLPYNGTPEQAIRSVYDQFGQGQAGGQTGSGFPQPQPPTTALPPSVR
jgi:membrane protein required for colicin V production